MGGFCSTCNHKKKLEIDRQLVTGISVSLLARQYNISKESLLWHKKHHLTGQLQSAYQKMESQNSIDLLSKIDEILTQAQNIFHRNYEKGRDALAIKALAEQRNTLQLLAQISHALHQAKQVELEQQRIESGESAKEEEEDWQESLKVLNDEELRMLLALSHKLKTGNEKLVIIPKDFNLDFMPDIDYSEDYYPPGPKGQESPKESVNFDIVEPEPEPGKRRTRFPNRVDG